MRLRVCAADGTFELEGLGVLLASARLPMHMTEVVVPSTSTA